MEGATRVQRFTRAVNAGIDQFGGDDDPSDLIDAVNRGQLSEDRLSESAYRVLLQKFQQGLFDHPYVDADAAGKIGNADFRHSMRSAARWCCRSCCR